MMLSGFRVTAVLAVAVLATACDKASSDTFNPVSPSATLARVRVLNATNTTYDFSSPAGEYVAVNSNIRHSSSRCFELDPNTAPLVRDSATHTELTGLPTTGFDAGTSSALLIYRATTTATTNSYLTWPTDSRAYTTQTDSGGLRILNASPNAGAIDVYLNIPNAAAVPPLTATNKVATNVAVGSATPYIPVKGFTSYQVRITRTGSTTSANTLVDATQTVLTGETATIVLGIPSLTAATTFRSFSVGGC